MALNPHTTEREFSGVPGALAITLGLPVLLFGLALVCNEHYSLEGVRLDWAAVSKQIPANWHEWHRLAFDRQCWMAYLAWFFLLVALAYILPGKHRQGVPLRDGLRLSYNINGMAMLGSLLALLAARLWQLAGAADPSRRFYLAELDFLYQHQLQLVLVTIIFLFALAVFVYVLLFVPLATPNHSPNEGERRQRVLLVNGNTGNPIYDWFIGRELNPRLGFWDVKMFCELRPGMLLWLLINLSCVHEQFHHQRALGGVLDSVVLITLLQAFYIFDGVLNEEGCLTMMDTTTDGFGFMLSFGDLAWVPWAYTLQARYVALPQNRVNLGAAAIAAIVALHFVGYYIFHLANTEKLLFRQGKLDHLKLDQIKTPTGSRLLCDGWWAKSQHINYFGDWLIGWLWCLPTGFQTPLTYFYVVYFALLLIHRQVRDSAKCREKYGALWQEYERRVPYKIVPWVY